MYLAIQFNNEIKIPERLKLLIIKALKLAIKESNTFDSEYTLFNNTRKNYNLKSEVAHITWYYNLFIREICDEEFFPGINSNDKYLGFIIDDLSYKDSFKHFQKIINSVYFTDSLISDKVKEASIIIDLNEFIVIRKDL